MITNISRFFQHKKLGKRLLSGAVATTLIVATILGDINIAYAQTDNGDISNIIVENDFVTNETETSADEGINEIAQDGATDEGIVVEFSEAEGTGDENAESANAENTNTEAVNAETVTDDAEAEEIEAENPEKSEAVEEKNKSEEKQSEEKDAEDMPAISIVETVEDYEISLECEKGTFVEGTTVEIKLLEDEEKEEVDKLVEESITEDIDIVKTVSFDITFHDKDGNVVEPADENSVSVKIVPSEQDKEELENVEVPDDEELLCSVFHVEEDEKVEEIECEVVDPVEEIIFEAESFSIYQIVWYKKGADGKPEVATEGPDEIGSFIKNGNTFINLDLPLSFKNEGSPADTSLRPDKFEFEVYGKDNTAEEPEGVLICKVTVPNYNKTSVSLKQSGKSQTEIPVYVKRGTQALGQGGDGKHVTAGFEYTVKLKGAYTETGAAAVYTITQDSTTIKITQTFNQAEWTATGTDTLIVERNPLESKKFYVSWVDNRNKAGKRPYSTNDNFTNDTAKESFKASIKLYRQVGTDVELVTNENVPTCSGPVVGKKGQSISDWEISYNNLPTVDSDGTEIKYFITIADPADPYNLTPSFSDWYSAKDFDEITVGGVSKKAILAGTTAKYIYSEYYTATVQWYDAGISVDGVRLTKEQLAEKFVITDENGEDIPDGVPSVVTWLTDDPTKPNEWKFKVGPLPMYDEDGGEKSYKLVLDNSVIDANDSIHEYSVDYSNGTKTASHEYCLSDGKIILVLDRPLDSFQIKKTWVDDGDQDRRKEIIESGARFLLWRYPVTKQDGTPGSPADRAAVFNPETHAQYSYTLKMTDAKVATAGSVNNEIDVDLGDFGVTTEHPVDMYDQYGHKYIYFATEVMSKSGYETVYENKSGSAMASYKQGVMHEGTMKNVRQEKIRIEGKVKWNVPSVNDYTNATVTIALQEYKDGHWVTVKDADNKELTKESSRFTITNPTKSYVFPDVDKYDENGTEIKYRVVQTNVKYSGNDIPVSYPNIDPAASFNETFVMNEKNYQAIVAPTPGTDNSYTIENRLAGERELDLTKIWADSGDKGFGKLDSECLPYPNITIKVYQHGAVTDYTKPYMTITTNGPDNDYFRKNGANTAETADFTCTITYRDGSGKGPETGKVIVTRYSDLATDAPDYKADDHRAKKWEFKTADGTKNITLPAFNLSGNAYTYSVEEESVSGAYTTYKYERKGNELDADVTNTYVTGGGSIRTVIFQKEWIDGTDIPQEKPIRFAIVRTDKDGKFIYTDSAKTEIDLRDNFGDTHIVTLTRNNNWYGQLGINVGETKTIDGAVKNRFDSIDEGSSKRYFYTAIELDMALSGNTDFLRKVNYNESSISETNITGTINAYVDASHEENHLPGYDVTVKSATGGSVVNATKYVAINKRKGHVNVTFDKTWQDGSNSESTRDGKYRVYVYQDGKKVVSGTPSDAGEVQIEGVKVFVDDKEKANGLAEIEYPATDRVNSVIKFEGLPQYDNNGNIYQYTVKEFLAKEDEVSTEKELEIALTDTKDSSKTGYVVTDYSTETHFNINTTDTTFLERNDEYNYTNTITGEKTGGAKFYVLWHDQTSYDKGIRPDVNYVLYYRIKGSEQTPQVYKGEFKLEWHPMPDTGTEKDPSNASRYYQYAEFTKLPLANDEGEPYEYFAVPSLNNPGEHYDEFYYNSYEDVEIAEGVYTSAGKHHYDMKEGATKLPDGSKMLPEDGIVEYIIDEFIHVEGNKIWKLDDNGTFDKTKLPDAKIFLWRENTHDKQYSENLTDNPTGKNCGETTLNGDKTGYAFKEVKDGIEQYIEFPKYDPYGLIYNYSVSEKMFITSTDENQKYKYTIPNYVMKYQPVTNGITNVYNPVEETGNLRKFTITKEWEGAIDKNPVAEFALYRVEIPLKAGYYTTSVTDDLLSPNPTAAAYKYAIDEFNEFKAGRTSTITELGVKSTRFDATDKSVVWENMPIFAPSGLVYLYFAEELSKQGMESFKYGVKTSAEPTRPTRPGVKVYNETTTGTGRTNVLISYNSADSAEDVRAGAVLFSNFGLVPSEEMDYESGSVHVNWQEAGYKNTFKNETFNKIVGYKEWGDGIFAENVRPRIVDNQCSDITLALTRSAATQTGHGNPVTTEDLSDDYEVKWYDHELDLTIPENKWRFEITPKEGATGEFKLYAANGRPYTYTVKEQSISGTTHTNYKITTKNASGSVKQVEKVNETYSVMTLQSALKNDLKGQLEVFKKWDDALDEHKLRSGYVNVLLQYRMVPMTADPYVVGENNDSNPPEISKWNNFGTTYKLNYNNHWSQSVDKLPVKSETIDGVNYRYEYRLLETEFTDMNTILYPVDISGAGAGQAGSVPINNVPNGGLCKGVSGENKELIYGNSTSTEPGYENKCYEIAIGNYHVNNSAIAAFNDTASSMNLFVDNRLSQKTDLKIEKKWVGVNAGEPEVDLLDNYGVLPNELTFKIEYREQDGDTWFPLYKDGTTDPVLVTVQKSVEKDEKGVATGYVSYVKVVDHLPKGIGDKILDYRAVEQKPDRNAKDNLGRFEFDDDPDGYPKLDHVFGHTTVTNKLEFRDITIRKKWNAEEELRKPVKVELWSDNFTTNKEADTFKQVNNTTTVLTAENGWEVTFNNLPKYNTKHEAINYYVKEAQIGGADFSTDNYAIYFFDQTGESEYYEVIDRYGTNENIAPIPVTAYEMYIVNTPKTSLSVIKKWDDEDNRQKKRANVEVELSNDDGIFVTPSKKELTTVDKNSVKWTALPIYKKPDVNFVKGSADHTSKVIYKIKEADKLKDEKDYNTPEYSFGGNSAVSASGYTLNLSNDGNSVTIKNTYNPPRIKFTATKKWDDEGNRHYSRPLQKGIYVTLYYSTDSTENKNWKKVDEKLSADYAEKNYPTGSKAYTLSNITQHIGNSGGDTWGEAVWEGLPTMISKGKPIYYKAFETDDKGNIKVTPGYSATYNPASIKATTVSGDATSQEIKNTLERTSILVRKEWGDTYDVSDRPHAVLFVMEYKCGATDSWKVYKNTDGTVFKVELTGENHTTSSTHVWETKVGNLPSTNSEGLKYEYRFKEVSVTYNGGEILADGVSAENVSNSIFTHNGNKWTSESTVGAFKDSVVTEPVSSSEYSYKVTAVNTPIMGELTVVKKWDDENNRDNLRPKEIKLQLYRKQNQPEPVVYGEPVVVGLGKTGTTVSIDKNEWSYTFKNLPVYNDDADKHTEENKSIYYVKEVDATHGYEVTYKPEMDASTVDFSKADNILMHISGSDKYSTSETITNKYTPVRIKISAVKEWMDGVQKFRPDSIKLKLQYRTDEKEAWKDVSKVASQSELDKTGAKVETTSALDRILTGSNGDDGVTTWEKDSSGNAVVWENLPAYVNNGKKVQYRLFEYDDTPDNQKISDHYNVVYESCEYDAKYGEEGVVKVQNIDKGKGGILTVNKVWHPDNKDDITLKDNELIKKIICHLEYKSKASTDDSWQTPDWGEFELSHEDNWQHTIVHELTSSAKYRVVEDAIVYINRENPTDEVTVTADANTNRVGSFVWESPEVEEEGENAQMHAIITNTVPDNSITVSKIWSDENNRDGKRPHSIKVRLLRDNQPVGEDVILFEGSTVDSAWETYTWHNLPVYQNGVLDADGKLVKSEYTIKEIVVEDSEFDRAYTTISYSVDGRTPTTDGKSEAIVFDADKPAKDVKVAITNLHETHKKTIKASKIWKDDENDKFNTRPKDWLGNYHTYFMLLYKLENKTVWEKVKYYPDYDDFEKRGYQYKDHHIYTTSPVIQEVNENTENLAIWENVSTSGIDGELTSENTDQPVSFMVIEVREPDYVFPDEGMTNPESIAPFGYEVKIEPKILRPEEEEEEVIEESTTLTNTLITTSLDVEKTWDDQDDKYKTRPEKVLVELERKLKNDPDPGNTWSSVKQLTEDKTVLELSASENESDNWKGTFSNLPLYDKAGKEYVYRAVEKELIYAGNKSVELKKTSESDDKKTLTAEGGNYISTMVNTSEGSSDTAENLPKFKLSLTNKLNGDATTSLTVTKKWKDENNRDRLRPGYITLNLLRDNVPVDTKTISGPDWEDCKWENLPLYKNGQTGLFGEKSDYTVTEETVAGYEPKIVKSADKLSVTLTNIHIPKKAVITADKIWEDSDNTYSTRPKEIYLRLMYKYEGEGDSSYRIVPEYSKSVFTRDGMYTSENAEGVFTTSKATQKCTGKSDENWTNAARWENLPQKARPISSENEPMTVVYKVIEVPELATEDSVTTSEASAGYEVIDAAVDASKLNTDDENNVKITNSLVTTELNITKVFEDEDNKYNTRPDSIEVQVLRRIKESTDDAEWKPVKVKGGLFGDDLIVRLTKAESFKKNLTDLPKYDKDRKEYEYSCLEKNLIFGDKKVSVDKSNVEASYDISGSEAEIKNTLITTSLTVTKMWDDNSNARGARPKKIVFNVERKETRDIASQIISVLTELFTGRDGYSEVKMLKDGNEKPVEIVIEGPEFRAYTLEGLPAYSEDGNPYSYRAIETKLVYDDREVMVENETSLYEKPTYQLEAIETGRDPKGNKAYKYSEKVVNTIIPIRHNSDEPRHEDPSPVPPVIVNPVPQNPGPRYEIIDEVDPEELPQKVTDVINDLIDLPDDDVRKDKVAKLYRDLVKIIQDDPTFVDKLDEETADIVIRFLKTGVLGRRRSKLPKTGGVVGSVMALLFASMLIGLGVAIRPDDDSDKKKKAQK